MLIKNNILTLIRNPMLLLKTWILLIVKINRSIYDRKRITGLINKCFCLFLVSHYYYYMQTPLLVGDAPPEGFVKNGVAGFFHVP